MRLVAPFLAEDLRELDERLLSRADEVVAMREIHAGERDPLVIGLRHDVDNTFEPCLQLARWEAERGYRATYFVLHDSPYWEDPGLESGLSEIASHGHEVGLHANALAVALETGRDPAEILLSALDRLRGWGHRVNGVVAHGDALCYEANFVNDELFEECVRPEYGAHDRVLQVNGRQVRIRPVPLAEFGLEYESLRLGRALYLSDSGGKWNEPFHTMADRFPSVLGQLHVLQHPCWWTQAFAIERAAA